MQQKEDTTESIVILRFTAFCKLALYKKYGKGGRIIMSRIYREQELTEIGQYFKIPGPGFLPKYQTPVSPRENFLMALEHQKPYWLPDYYDTVTLCPACYPDAIARGFVMGAEGAEYMADENKGGRDAFGIEWEYVPVANGSMVRPGNPLLNDMTEWKEKVTLPDVDSWEWEKSRKANEEFLAKDDHVRVMWIFTGFFERLISLLEFEDAAIALIDEEQKEAVHEFFDACCTCYEKIARHYKEDFGCDILYVHDDWGSQRAPFFSVDTCMEMLVPYVKRLVDYTHSLGMKYQMHSCGKNETLMPCYLAAGVDIWEPQAQNDVDLIIQEAKGKIMIGLWGNTPDADDETAYAAGAALAEKYSPEITKHPVYHCDLFDIHEKYREGMYVTSRKILGTE